jgi:hypothetical protein
MNPERRWSWLALPLFLMAAAPAVGWAAPKAWLIGDDAVAAKLDLTQQAIVQTINIEERIRWDDEAIDLTRGNVFIPYGRGPVFYVQIRDLKTLQPKNVLDFGVREAPTRDVETIRFIFPPTGTQFFVRWSDPDAAGGAGGFDLATIDATTFQTIGHQVVSPPLEATLMLDASGRTLYSITSRKPAHVDVFDLPGFTRSATIDLEAVLNPAAFGRSIHGFRDGKLLVNENEKTRRQDPERYTLFVFDVASGQITPKVRTGLEGRGTLLPRTNRILFNEEIVPPPGTPGIRPGEVIGPGRLHVYDTLTGARLGTVNVAVEKTGRVLGVSPAEDTVYYQSYGARAANPKLSIIDLRTLAVVKELPLPFAAGRMVVFDE